MMNWRNVSRHSYSTTAKTGRDGAGDEVVNLHDSLTHIGFSSKMIEWDLVVTLPSVIYKAIRHLSTSTVSVVVVCIMSHGKLGALSDSAGSQIPVNYILHQLSDMLPRNVTLVSEQ